MDATMNDGKRTLLVIEDNELNREMLEEILADAYFVLSADNGASGLEVLRKERNKISAILLDIDMPVMNGYEFMERVSADRELASVPIIVLTGHDSEEEEERCLEMGASDFLTKPYKTKLALARIKNVIRVRETARQLNELERDELTNLYTKRTFLQKAEEYVRRNPGKKFGVLSMDVENFKLTNNQYGEAVCDEFLGFVGRSIQRIPHCIAGRFGGDQYVMLVESDTLGTEEEIAENFRRVMEDAPIAHQVLKVGIVSPIEPGTTMLSCCDMAFLAIREIKGVYGKDVVYFEDKLRQQLLEEQKIQDCMELALKENQFCIYYQPKHDSITNLIVGAEALVRWIHPEYGFMSPGKFIPLFEKNGFVTKIDAYVIKKVCEDMRRWRGAGLPVVPISINISRRDFLENGWIEERLQEIDANKIPHELIHMEVTESLYAEYTDLIVDQVRHVQEEGYLIEMDDFGSGYSSLGMLATFPLDVIKLDISFVRQLETNEIVIENIIKLAHRMGFRTVAEGVETEKQCRILRGLGCDMFQGYYFSKPLPVDQFEQYMQNRTELHSDKNEQEIQEEAYINRKWSDITGELEILNTLLDCIRTLSDKTSADVRIGKFLAIIGRFYGADKAYIYEADLEKHVVNNTFEWCNEGVAPLRDKCQNMSIDLSKRWYDSFGSRGELYLATPGDIEQFDPFLMQVLAKNAVRSLLAAPLRAGDSIVGYVGVDNPTAHTDSLELMSSVTSFVKNELDRTRYIRQLEYVSYMDSLTGLKNRSAYYADLEKIKRESEKEKKPLGIVYADVNGLKHINDLAGHEIGDELLKNVADKLRAAFPDGEIYRLGGDEFVVIDQLSEQKLFEERVGNLNASWTDECSAAIGCCWISDIEDLDTSIVQADRCMYHDKRRYYQERANDRRRR